MAEVGVAEDDVTYSLELNIAQAQQYGFSGFLRRSDDVYSFKMATESSHVTLTSLQVDFRPRPTHFLSELILKHHDREYRSDVTFDYVISVDSLGFDLQLRSTTPITSFTSSLQANFKKDEVTLSADTYISDRKYALTSRVTFDERVEVVVKLVYPGRKLSLKSDTRFVDRQLRHVSRVSWERGRVLVLSLDGVLSFQDGRQFLHTRHRK